MPRISVVIPCYNYARFLPAAIDSALRQTVRDAEIIVVDDGSTDDTAQVAQRFGDRVRYYRQDNRGLSAARNSGCRIATGEHFAFLDADDLWDADKLERQLAVCARDEAVGLVSGQMRFVDASGGPMPGDKPGTTPGETLADIVRWGTAAPSSFMVRRHCFEEVGGFDEHLKAMEDLDFCLRIARRHRIVYLPEPVGSYRVHGPSLSGKPEKVYPSYITIFERLLRDPEARGSHGLIRHRLARCRYLWGTHQVKAGVVHEGARFIRQSLGTWPFVGWSLDPSSSWWRRAGHAAKPYALLVALWAAPKQVSADVALLEKQRS